MIGDRPFPPPTITKWVRYQGVSTEKLAEELRYWADAFDALTELEASARIDGQEGA